MLHPVITFYPESPSSRTVKQDFIHYCEDLHLLEGGYLHFSSIVGFSFPELFELFVLKHQEAIPLLTSADIILVVHNTYDYDPDHAHIVAFLGNRLAFSGEILAFSAGDDVLLHHASHLLELYLEENQKAVVLRFEQPILPLIKEGVVVPFKEANVTLFLSQGIL